MFIKNYQGMTLIDLLIALTIMSILFGIGAPALSKYLDLSKLKSHTFKLHTVLQLARKTAITESQKVTVCPTEDQQQCTKNWSQGYMVFIDHNANRLFDEQDSMIFQTEGNEQDIKIRWRAFGQRNSLQWHHTGITNHQNGSFVICFRDNAKLSRALIITKAGRIRLSTDENGDGIHENAQGNNVSCN